MDSFENSYYSGHYYLNKAKMSEENKPQANFYYTQSLKYFKNASVLPAEDKKQLENCNECIKLCETKLKNINEKSLK